MSLVFGALFDRVGKELFEGSKDRKYVYLPALCPFLWRTVRYKAVLRWPLLLYCIVLFVVVYTFNCLQVKSFVVCREKSTRVRCRSRKCVEPRAPQTIDRRSFKSTAAPNAEEHLSHDPSQTAPPVCHPGPQRPGPPARPPARTGATAPAIAITRATRVSDRRGTTLTKTAAQATGGEETTTTAAAATAEASTPPSRTSTTTRSSFGSTAPRFARQPRPPRPPRPRPRRTL